MSVIQNRVNSKNFGNTYYEVITAKGQFAPYKSGKLIQVLSGDLKVCEECRSAVRDVRNSGPVGTWLYFKVKDGKTNGTIIGDHVFY